MRVVVAGATGNIGSSLMRALLTGGHQATGVARRLPDPEARDPRASCVPADLSRPDGVVTLRNLLRHADAYVHLAWPLQPMRRRRYLRRAGPQTMSACVGAALDAGVDRVVHLSSVAAYRDAPRGVLIDENWALGGVGDSAYGRHKAEGERTLAAELSARGAQDRVTVLRPCLVAQRAAGGQMMRCGAPALVPGGALRQLTVLPVAADFAMQMVHADDVATAVVGALDAGAHGHFNIAADGMVTGTSIAEALGARAMSVPKGLLRGTAAAAWHLRALPLDPTWFDMASRAPHMSTDRARRELGWRPRHDATDVLRELVTGMRGGTGGQAPALRPRTLRDEVLTGLRHGSVARRRHN